MAFVPVWRPSVGARSSRPAGRAAASGSPPEITPSKPHRAHFLQNLFGRAPVAGTAMREPRNAGSEEDIRPKARRRPPARLKKRADFVQAAKGQRAQGRSFSLQAVRRKGETEPGPPRFGFTVTKKVGGAVVRNRIRRRLKEALRLAPDLLACPGYDYVILGRQAALSQEFAALQEELARAIADVHARASVARPSTTRSSAPCTVKSRRHSVCPTPSKMKD